MTDAELKAEMKRREAAKQGDRKAYKELVNEAIPPLMGLLKDLSADIAMAKATVFENVGGLLDLKANAYGIKDDQQSHTFTTDKGDSITLGYRVNDGWDDTVGSGIAKVNAFLQSLAKDDDSAKLVGTIQRLLKKDAKGNLKSSRVLELASESEKWGDAEFSDGVRIIMDAYAPVATCFFIDARQKDGTGKDQNIALSISSADFPQGTELPEYFNLNKDQDGKEEN